MKVILDIENNKAPLFMELVKSLDYITVVKEVKEEKMFNSDNIKTFNWVELYCLEHEINSCFTSLKETLMYHEDIIKYKLEKLKQSIEKDYFLKLLNAEEGSQYHSQLYDSEESAINTMKYLQRNAILVSSYSILEIKLKKLCQLLKSSLKLEKQLNKKIPGNNDIERIRNYLISEVGVAMRSSNLILLQIENDKILRNAIVHFDGIIEETKRNSFIIPSGIIIDAWEARIESPEYLIFLIDKMQKFINELFKEVDLKIPKPETGQN